MDRAELSQTLRAWLSREPFDVAQGREGAEDREPILISEPDPARFMTALADAVASEADVFLCDPNWGAAEKAQVETLLKSKIENQKSQSPQGWLMIPTGGTSGRVKFARHDQDTLMAAVGGFTRHFDLNRVNAVGVLPLHHVSGLMAWLRCALTGGEYRPLDWKAVESGARPELPIRPGGWVISLVPTQLERLLRQPVATAWLAKFRIVFLGGAPAGSDLLNRAAVARIPLAPGYGMTETAAMVVALRPEEFLAGARSSGPVLPHARVSLADDDAIKVEADSLFRGYYPEWRKPEGFLTADAGWLDAQGQLHVQGRRDDVIITGGEKVNPAEVEALLRDSGEFAEIVVVGMPDREWGRVLVAAYPASRRPDLEKLAQILAGLTPAKRPKRFVPLDAWPLTGAGKVNRAELARLVREKLAESTKQRSS